MEPGYVIEQEGKASSLKKKKKTCKETLRSTLSNVCTGTFLAFKWKNEKKFASVNMVRSVRVSEEFPILPGEFCISVMKWIHFQRGAEKSFCRCHWATLHMCKSCHLQWATWTLQIALADCLLPVSVMILGYKCWNLLWAIKLKGI